MKKARTLIAVTATLSLLVSGCERTNPQAVDTLRLAPEEERDLFVASTWGPDESVMVLEKVEKARYENGVIVLRPHGRVLAVVHPQAWRQYTGTAYTVEEAERMIARADRMDQALRDLGAAAAELKAYLATRATRSQEETLRQQESLARSRQQIIAEADQAKRAYAREIEAIDADLEARIQAVERERDDALEKAADAHGRRAVELAEVWTRREKEIAQRQARDRQQQKEASQSEVDLATASHHDELAEVASRRGAQAARELAARQDAESGRLHGERDADVAAQRAGFEAQVADLRRLAAAKAERARADAQTHRQAVERDALKAATEVQPAPPLAPDPGVPGPAGATTPAPAPRKGT